MVLYYLKPTESEEDVTSPNFYLRFHHTYKGMQLGMTLGCFGGFLLGRTVLLTEVLSKQQHSYSVDLRLKFWRIP